MRLRLMESRRFAGPCEKRKRAIRYNVYQNLEMGKDLCHKWCNAISSRRAHNDLAAQPCPRSGPESRWSLRIPKARHRNGPDGRWGPHPADRPPAARQRVRPGRSGLDRFHAGDVTADTPQLDRLARVAATTSGWMA